jgi:hypothetical protein
MNERDRPQLFHSKLNTPLTDQQTIEIIDLLTGDDFCMDLEMRNADAPLTGDLKIAFDKLSRIYRIAHAQVQSHSCFEVHDDWRREAAQTFAALRNEL